jgi:L-lactate dehydrogenase complex protein LldG
LASRLDGGWISSSRQNDRHEADGVHLSPSGDLPNRWIASKEICTPIKFPIKSLVQTKGDARSTQGEFSRMVQETMSTRDQILGKMEALDPVNHPGDFKGASEDFDFKTSLEVVGARVLTAEALEIEFPGRRRYDKTMNGLSLSEVEVLEVDGEFGVAENGAIWLTEEALPHRVAPFICQHLVINVKKIVPNMHAAYEELKKPSSSFGLFLAGPSKTADIEQSLVIGAHGARSLTVVIRS